MPVSASSATARKPGAASVCSVPPGAEPGAAQEVRTHARLSAIAAPAAARERVRWLINTVVTPSTVVVARTAPDLPQPETRILRPAVVNGSGLAGKAGKPENFPHRPAKGLATSGK